MNAKNKTESGRRLQALPASVLAVVVICLVGCHTAGYKKSDAAALNSQEAARRVKVESQQIEATIGALNDLVNQPAADAQPQFRKFDKALDELDDSAERADGEVNRIWDRRAAYIAAWEKEIPTIQDPATRSLSEARKTEVSNKFDTANRQYDEARNGMQSLIAYLRDIRKALSTDLTRNGLVAIKPSVSNANDRARQAQAALAQAATELDTLSAQTASFRVQEIR